MNEISIYQKQNEPNMLLLLKTQRELYSKAKKVFYSGTSISIILTIIFTLLTFICKNQYVDAVSFLFSILTIIFNIVCTYQSDSLKEKAAKIQQTFNYRLYDMKLNYGTLNDDDLADITADYKSANFDKERDWYKEYPNSSKLKQIYHCQLQDIRWDKKLRGKFRTLNIIMASLLIIFVIAFAFLSKLPIGQRFVYVIWIVPILQYMLNLLKDIFSNFNTLNDIRAKQVSIENNLDRLTESELQQQLEDLQLCIFEHRKRAFLIPDWFYKLYEKTLHEHENNLSQQNN